VVGIFKGHALLEMFIWTVALAVAIIPEALPAVMAVTLSLGVRRMVKRNALIRRLQAVETLGSTSVICTDKTGTLTEDKMSVRNIWVNDRLMDLDGVGYEPTGNFSIEGKLLDSQEIHLKKLLTIGVLCNDSRLHDTKEGWTIKGDPTEGALLVAAAKAGIYSEETKSLNPRHDEIPFSSERKRMTTMCATDKGMIVYSKGAIEVILDECSHVYRNDKEVEITHDDKKIY